MKHKDLVRRFSFVNEPIRGQLVTLDASWQEIINRSEAGEYARTMLGHALAAVSLIASTLKFDGSITLQIKGNGPVNLLVVEATSARTIRGVVRQSQAEFDETLALIDIFGADKMVITINSGKGRPYQGIVPLTGQNLSEALVGYFEHSEQLQTHLWLAADANSAAGMLIQKMPPKSDNLTGPDNLTGSNDYKESHDEDAWSRVIQLSETIKPEELLELDSETIVYRLFHEEDVKIFEEQQVSFHCSCTRSRTDAMLVTLGKTEIKQVLAEEGEISIQCEFCNEVYRYDAIDVEKLFIDNLVEPSENRHH